MLIVVGVVLIGIAVALAFDMFIDQSASTNRDAISNDLVQYAAQAQKYYRRPTALGGGNNSFGGLTLSRITSNPANANGSYELSPDPVPGTATSVTLIGTGIENGTDGSTPVKLTMTVTPDSIVIVANN
jgi:Tfp pilus assembly protein PilE